MAEVIRLPESRVPIVAETDVLVAGGGTAGRQGAQVILLERLGYLGGLASGGLIILLLTVREQGAILE